MVTSLCPLIRKGRRALLLLILPSVATKQIRGEEEEDTGGGLERCHRPYSDRTQTFCRGRQEPDSAGLNNAGQMSLSLCVDSPLSSHNNIRGLFGGREKANIERSNRTNKNRVYLATCGPAGWETVARRHEVLGDSAR